VIVYLAVKSGRGEPVTDAGPAAPHAGGEAAAEAILDKIGDRPARGGGAIPAE
jgi:hypothetical protein